jgi:hypothetical protein
MTIADDIKLLRDEAIDMENENSFTRGEIMGAAVKRIENELQRLQDAEALLASAEIALRDALSVCETLPGKLEHENPEGAFTEIEWLEPRVRAALTRVAAPGGEKS